MLIQNSHQRVKAPHYLAPASTLPSVPRPKPWKRIRIFHNTRCSCSRPRLWINSPSFGEVLPASQLALSSSRWPSQRWAPRPCDPTTLEHAAPPAFAGHLPCPGVWAQGWRGLWLSLLPFRYPEECKAFSRNLINVEQRKAWALSPECF